MPCGMSPVDIRRLLEGYCMDVTFTLAGDASTVDGSAVLTFAAGVPSGLLPLATASGAGLPAGAYAVEVDVTAGTVTLNAPVVGTQPSVTVSFLQFRDLSDDWIINTRDCQVLPMVERAAGVSLSGVTRVTEYHSGTGSSLLVLNRKPVVEVHSINLITNPQNWVYVSPSSVEAVSEEGILKLRAVLESWQNYVPAFPRGKDNIKVDYIYGYATAPDDLKRAVCMLTASFALGMLGSRTGGGSLSVQGHSRTYGARGKYHDARQELDCWAHSLVRKYISGMAGS